MVRAQLYINYITTKLSKLKLWNALSVCLKASHNAAYAWFIFPFFQKYYHFPNPYSSSFNISKQNLILLNLFSSKCKYQLLQGSLILLLLFLMQAVSDGGTDSQILDLSNRFYTLIPHDFGMKKPPLLNNLDYIKVLMGKPLIPNCRIWF